MIERERAVYRFFSFLIKSKRLEDLVEDWALLRKKHGVYSIISRKRHAFSIIVKKKC